MINDSLHGHEIIHHQARALAILGEEIMHNETFAVVVELIYECKGVIYITGVGKSGIVAKKMAGTLCATGTPATFLHPLDALHGDLGKLTSRDMLIMFSKSGTTHEIMELINRTRLLVGTRIGITTKAHTALAVGCTKSIVFKFEAEAGPLKEVPTTSTICMMALGDALALCVMSLRNFTREDYDICHPGGEK